MMVTIHIQVLIYLLEQFSVDQRLYQMALVTHMESILLLQNLVIILILLTLQFHQVIVINTSI